MDNLFQFLRDLLASGQSGIVIIMLLVLIGGAIFVIWSQKQALSRIELNMKAADTARQQSQNFMDKQNEIIVQINDELRKELERYKDNQVKFEDDVKRALSVGFSEVKDSLNNMTVSEILHQIPAGFKKDLENEIVQASEQAIQSLEKRLIESKELENGIFNTQYSARVIQDILLEALYHVLPEHSRMEYYRNHSPSNSFQKSLALMKMEDRDIDNLARKIAARLHDCS